MAWIDFQRQQLTWGEFKRQVEAQGVTDDLAVLFIDWEHGNSVQVDRWSSHPYIEHDGPACAIR